MRPRSTRVPDDRVIFLQQFLRNPRQIGSVIPSSRYLERRVVALADIAHARTIVELGTGTGGITRAVLTAMPADARLVGIEINPRLHQLLSGFDDPRLIAHFGSAEQLAEILRRHQLPPPDVVVSGIPFSTMDRELGSRVLAAIAAALAPGGRFVAYQVSAQVARLARPVLGTPRRQIELRNIPPMRVYRWDRPAETPAVQRAVGT
ncbi:MAG: methyltransferase type 12 [Porticoccaceae bacterium]|nr:methyltransferase type 12 [Porticoccaceae bacterium]